MGDVRRYATGDSPYLYEKALIFHHAKADVSASAATRFASSAADVMPVSGKKAWMASSYSATETMLPAAFSASAYARPSSRKTSHPAMTTWAGGRSTDQRPER